MFALNEEEIAAVQAAWDESGELAAAIELRRLFPGIADLEGQAVRPHDRRLETARVRDVGGDGPEP